MLIKQLSILSVIACWLVTDYGIAQVQDLVKEQVATGDAARKSQVKIDEISEQTQAMLDEYRMILREKENLRIYNEQMQRLVNSQNSEMQSIKEQIVSIEQTHKEVVPLMLEMLETLEQFVILDTPFLPEERERRIVDLKNQMDRADVSTSEKYRRVLEAFQVEGEYGRTIEAYRDTITRNDKPITVDVLRVGRIALLYQTLDGDDTGIWNQEKQSWETIPSRYRRSVSDGLRIAKRQAAPDLVTLPIKAPEVVQ